MLHKETTSDELLRVLKQLMLLPDLADFRLVGGTALSLFRGHRISDDIDLFTNRLYGTTSFTEIEAHLKQLFPYVFNVDIEKIPALKVLENNYGLHLFLGSSENNRVKTDILYWNSEFIFPAIEVDNIRLATIEEISVMKLDAVARGGRKKDFWDLSEIFETHSLHTLLGLYEKKYPYNDLRDVMSGLSNFAVADKMPDPVCLKGKHWEVIRSEMIKIVDAV
jgi:Nucleotidyl transferase AbiEii toxin, Type IV TA system